MEQLTIIIAIFLCTVSLILYLLNLKINKKKKLIAFVSDVWVDELLPINFLQNKGIYMLSDKVTSQKTHYRSIIECCSRKDKYIFFRATGSSIDSVYSDKIIVTEIIESDRLNADDYVIIFINDVFYLRKVYRLDDNILYYKYKDDINEYTVGQIVLRVKFMFNKNLLISYEK